MKKHVYLYKTSAEREEISSANPVSVLFTQQTNQVEYTYTGKIHDYSKDYLTFEALEDTTFTFTTNALQYSLDNGSTWTTLAAGTASPTVTVGNKIMWKQTGLSPTSSAGIGTFSSTGNFNAQGNIMSLYYGDNFVNEINLNGKSYAFCKLFNGCKKIILAEDLILPATTLASSCYNNMFYGCTNLISVPELPAVILAQRCYSYMFQNCTSLTSGPQLPAKTATYSCYDNMFSGCTSLTVSPELPANKVDGYAYRRMFNNCTSLTTAPELPATTLGSDCYQGMFYDCTSLINIPSILPATTLKHDCYCYIFRNCINITTVPVLPATTLTTNCYQGMFSGCTSLTVAPELPATTLAQYCYYEMFDGCTNLTTAPELPATTLVDFCYMSMFIRCAKLNYIKCLATDISASYCTESWTYGVASSGTFIKCLTKGSWETGANGIPSGWTVVTNEHSGGTGES